MRRSATSLALLGLSLTCLTAVAGHPLFFKHHQPHPHPHSFHHPGMQFVPQAPASPLGVGQILQGAQIVLRVASDLGVGQNLRQDTLPPPTPRPACSIPRKSLDDNDTTLENLVGRMNKMLERDAYKGKFEKLTVSKSGDSPPPASRRGGGGVANDGP